MSASMLIGHWGGINCITSTLRLLHCSSGDRRGLLRTDQTIPGCVTRLVVTQRARLADLQPVHRVSAGLALSCKRTTKGSFARARALTVSNRSYLCIRRCCGSAGKLWRIPRGRTCTLADPPGPGRSPASSSHTRYVPGRSRYPPGTGLQ